MKLCAAALLATSASWAVTPEQAGTYTGTLKTTSLSETGEKTTVKADVSLSIAENNDTVFTIGGVVTVSGAEFDGNEGIFQYVPDPISGSLAFSTLHIKKTSIKGSGNGFITGPPFRSLTTKISLKKTGP